MDEEDGETFTVRLSDPDNATLKAGGETATGTIDDNDGAPEVSITGAPVVVEGTSAAFVVELSTESRKTVTVSYATADGTALASEDYTAVLATELEFTSGQTAQTISVATTVDGLDEEDGETFTVRPIPTRREGRRRARRRRRAGGEHPGAPVVVEGTAARSGGAEHGEPQDGAVSYATADGTSEDGGVGDGAGVHLGTDGADDRRRRSTGWTRKTARRSGEAER